MLSPELFTEIDLHGSHSVRIYNHSKVYFGDYYCVRLEVRCEIPLPLDPDESAEMESPDLAVYSRFLERMAVPSAAVETVSLELIDEFRRNSLPYLATPGFPAKLIATALSKRTGVTKRCAVI